MWYRWETLVTEAVFTYTVCVAELDFGHGRNCLPFQRVYLLKLFFFFLQEKKKLIISKIKKVNQLLSNLKTISQDAKPVQWVQSPKGLMTGVLGGTGWLRSCSGPQWKAEEQAGEGRLCQAPASRAVAGSWPSWAQESITALLWGTYSLSFLSVPGPQNGWNDPPALNRAAKKKKVL